MSTVGNGPTLRSAPARMMQRLTWAETARQMKDVVLTAARSLAREAA
jgi:hypothetical protein